jgi:hypothetical protein
MAPFFPIHRDEPGVKIHRATHPEGLLANQNLKFLCVDGIVFQSATQRKFGRVPGGHRARAVTPAVHSVNRSFCTALSPFQDLVHYEKQAGATSDADFDGFINDLAIDVDQLGIPNPCSVYDNCRIHNEDHVLNLCIAHGQNYHDTCSYSPMLNLIMGCINDVKGANSNPFRGRPVVAATQLGGLRYGQRAP